MLKVFLGQLYVVGFVNNPADGLAVTVPMRAFDTEGGVDNGPRNFDAVIEITMGLADTMDDLFEDVFDQVVIMCGNLGWPTPTTAEVYADAPIWTLTQMAPPVI